MPVWQKDMEGVEDGLRNNDEDLINDLVGIAAVDFNINLPANLSPVEKLTELKKSNQYDNIKINLAQSIYNFDPYFKIFAKPQYLNEGVDPNKAYALQDVDGTYRIYFDDVDMTERVTDGLEEENIARSATEARIQLQLLLEEENLMYQRKQNDARWRQVIDNLIWRCLALGLWKLSCKSSQTIKG